MALHVFLHVPKTAGSSLRTVLSREYGARRVAYADLGMGSGRGFEDLAGELRPRLARGEVGLVTGHQYLGLHAALGRACTYFTLLRDPIERVLSEYFYAFTYPHHRLREEITSGRLPPMEFLASRRYAQPGAQAAQLAGPTRRPVLEAALAHVEHAITAVGLAEEFDRSLLLLARRLSWAPPLFIARNVTRLEGGQAEARARAREEAEAHRPLYALDNALHEAARRRFEADLAEEGPEFGTAFAAFARLQAELSARAGDLVYQRYEFRGDDALPPFAEELKRSAEWRAVADWLASPPGRRRRLHNFTGAIDSAEGGVIRGWAADLLDPAPVTLRLMDGEEEVGATRAQLRHGEWFCGFRLPLPAGRRDPWLVFGVTRIAVPDPAALLGAPR